MHFINVSRESVAAAWEAYQDAIRRFNACQTPKMARNAVRLFEIFLDAAKIEPHPRRIAVARLKASFAAALSQEAHSAAALQEAA